MGCSVVRAGINTIYHTSNVDVATGINGENLQLCTCSS